MNRSNFHNFTKLASCSKLKCISLQKSKLYARRNLGPRTLFPLSFSSCFSFGTSVFWFSCLVLPACFVRIVISSYEINMSPPRDISVVASAGLCVWVCVCSVGENCVCGCHVDGIRGSVNAAAAISPAAVRSISPASHLVSPICYQVSTLT